MWNRIKRMLWCEFDWELLLLLKASRSSLFRRTCGSKTHLFVVSQLFLLCWVSFSICSFLFIFETSKYMCNSWENSSLKNWLDSGNSCTYSHGVLVGRICYKLIFSFMWSLGCDVRADSKDWWHLRAYILEIWLRKPVKCPILLCALCWVAIVLLQCQIMVLSTSWWFIDVFFFFFFEQKKVYV